MDREAPIVLELLASPMIIVVVHAALSRAFRAVSPQLNAVRSLVVAGLPTLALIWATGGGGVLIYGGAVYGLIAYTYFHFFNMSETARRIRILYEIYHAGSLSSRELERHYTPEDMLANRLPRLVALNQLRREGEWYVLDRKTLYIASRMVFFWRRMLGLETARVDRIA